MGNLTNLPSTFRSIIIHATKFDMKHCSRDILVSPSITLYELHKNLLNAFALNELLVEHHNFILTEDQSLSDDNIAAIETSFEIIDTQQDLEGFLTPVTPGVYIEHSHPHEPLPSFSVDSFTSNSNNINTDCNRKQQELLCSSRMSFRIVRDERSCTLDSISCSSNQQLNYEIQYGKQHQYYCINLQLQKVNLPIHFYQDVHMSLKVINRKGHFFTNHNINNSCFVATMKAAATTNYNFSVNLVKEINKTNTIAYRHASVAAANNSNSTVRLYEEMDEQLIKTACIKTIETLIEERRKFVMNQKHCAWIEPSGEECIYCTLVMR